MARALFEFECTECHKIFDVKLNVSLNGHYRVHCPNCGHIHYRDILNGQITMIRFNEHPQKDSQYIIEDIWPMKSSIREEHKEDPERYQSSATGFIKRLWAEAFTH